MYERTASRQILAAVLKTLRIQLGGRRGRCRPELGARDAGGLQQPALHEGQPLDPGLDELVEAARHLESDPLQGHLQLPAGGRARD